MQVTDTNNLDTVTDTEANKLDKNRLKNPLHEMFCHYFTLEDETRGNAMRAYAAASGTDMKTNWKSAAIGGSRLLKRLDVCRRINEMLQLVMNDATVDNELSYVINQKEDLGAKTQAIREYNKLKQRIIEKIDHTSGGKPLVIPSDVLLKNGISTNANTSTEENSIGQTQV